MVGLDVYLAAKRRYEIWSSLAMVPLLLLLLAALVAVNVLSHNESSHPPAVGDAVLAIGIFLGGMAVSAAATARLHPGPKDYPELHCPHCESFISQDRAGLVVATGKCPNCFKQVVKPNQEEISVAYVPLMLPRLRRAKRIQAYLLLLLLAPFVGIMLLINCVIFYHALPFTHAASELLGIVTSGVIVCYIVGTAWVAVSSRVNCPRCHKTIDGAVSTVIASGNCPKCGATIVEGVEAWQEYRPLPKLANVTQAGRRFRRRQELKMFAAGVLAIGLMGAAMALDKLLPASGNWSALVRAIGYGSASLLALGVTFGSLLIRRNSNCPELACGQCGKQLDGSNAVALCTGNCPHCGERMIKDA